MKKVLIVAILFTAFFSCKKTDTAKTNCYECDISSIGSGDYHDVGCYTDAEWNTVNVQIKDSLGTRNLDKSKCRKK